MRELFLGLYAEGPTDDLFLPILIQRTAEDILTMSKGEIVEVRDVLLVNRLIKRQVSGSIEQIMEASRFACNCHVLFIHCDADDFSIEARREYNFSPGYDRVMQAHAEGVPVCSYLMPVIPVRMIESWILADIEALLNSIHSSKESQDIQLPPPLKALPIKSHEIEAYPEPKAAVRFIIDHAHSNRRPWSANILYEQAAKRIRLDHLRKLPAFIEFEREFTEILLTMGMVKH